MTDSNDPLDRYRAKIGFDDTAMIGHPVDCYPDSCSLTGYLDDGELRYQEQTGTYPVVDEETPDWNPRGCSRQCSYTDATYGDERIRQPMRQTGERGGDGWEPISWDEAYRLIAEHVVDAMEENTQSIVTEQPPTEGGSIQGVTPFNMLTMELGGVNIDMDALVGDTYLGQNLTFGKFHYCSSHDDWFKSDVVLIWHSNPAYTRNPSYHFLTEARYDGAEIVTIAPDHSPSAVHADRYVPVEPASDAALALGMARVVIEEDLADWAFVREQTDMPLLVREDTDRFLRESDVEEDGSDDRFYLVDATAEGDEDDAVAAVDDGSAGDGAVRKAPWESLDLDGIEPALEGEYEVALADGETVAVRPVFARMRERLDADYDLASVEDVTGVHPDVVEELARTVAENDAMILNGFNLGKVFHGDLIERAMAFLLGVTGNWGREGTGMRGWGAVFELSAMGDSSPNDPMVTEAVRQTAERELTDEEVAAEAMANMVRLSSGMMVPAAWWWYRHCGYDEVWADADLEPAGYPRSIPAYADEADAAGWWEGVDLPKADVDPSVLFLVGSNTLRRTRGGRRVLLDELWPKLDLIVACDYRWSTTALYSDVVLPAAFHHEKEQFDSMTATSMRFYTYCDQAIQPRHDTKTEMRMLEELVATIEEVAAERGLEEYEVPHGLDAESFNEILDLADTGIGEIPAIPEQLQRSLGKRRRYDALYERTVEEQEILGDMTVQGFGEEQLDALLESVVANCKDVGIFGDDESLDGIRERGWVQSRGLGESVEGLNQAADVEDDDTVTALSKHVEEKQRFPSLTGRAQFYVDHPWFLEADEHLPCHKDPPAGHGGDRDEYPYFITSGHNRHSTQAVTLANERQMNQHRGEPHMLLSRSAAAEEGIEDGDRVRVHNDYGSFEVQAKVSSQPADDQVVLYHAWDPYLYPDGSSHHELTPGIVKPLHFAGGHGYDYLEYHYLNWQPQQADRHVTVDVEPVE